jgi:hypothetical protein
VDLAPAYAAGRWQLGNYYLRRGREADALAELRLAARSHTLYRDQVYSLLWDYFAKDADRLVGLASGDADNTIALAYFLAARGRGDHALTLWNNLDENEKAFRQPLARSIAHGLFAQKAFPQALEFSRQLGFDANARFESVTNGSFERPLEPNEDSRFNWQIGRADAKLEIGTDGKIFREGSRSLRLNFRNFTKPTLINVIQTIALEPETGYRLKFWARTDGLRSAGMPLVEIVNANTDVGIARSSPFTTGTADWLEVTIEFATPRGCNGMVIRTVRSYCGEDCPLMGTLWYDDFRLEKN